MVLHRDRLVSVCIPSCDGARYLAAAIQSVQAQTFEDFELLVVDDGSRDGTREVVSAVRDPRVRLVTHRVRSGLVANWNRCLELARGRYVTVFHQDDLMAPDNVEAKVAFLEAEHTAGLVYSDVAQIDANDRLLSEHWYEPPRPEDDGRHDGLVFFRRLVSGANLVCAPSVLLRREVYERLGGFDPRLPFTADWEMWLRTALFYDVGYLARPLVRYRRHDAMETARFSWGEQLAHGFLAKMLALAKYPDRVPEVDALRSRISGEYRGRALARMRQERDAGHVVRAAEYLSAALDTCTRVHANEPAAQEIVDTLEAGAPDARARAAVAEARAVELARALADRDRTIEAMTRTRAWRLAQRWWKLRRAANTVMGRR